MFPASEWMAKFLIEEASPFFKGESIWTFCNRGACQNDFPNVCSQSGNISAFSCSHPFLGSPIDWGVGWTPWQRTWGDVPVPACSWWADCFVLEGCQGPVVLAHIGMFVAGSQHQVSFVVSQWKEVEAMRLPLIEDVTACVTSTHTHGKNSATASHYTAGEAENCQVQLGNHVWNQTWGCAFLFLPWHVSTSFAAQNMHPLFSQKFTTLGWQHWVPCHPACLGSWPCPRITLSSTSFVTFPSLTLLPISSGV